MKCPYCGADNNTVTESRERKEKHYRRRECLSCGKRFNTSEQYCPEEEARAKSGRKKKVDLDCALRE